MRIVEQSYLSGEGRGGERQGKGVPNRSLRVEKYKSCKWMFE